MDNISLNMTLRNIATELVRLAEIARRTDEVVGDIISQTDPEGLELVEALQDVDLLSQSLDCLVFLLGNLADHCDISQNIPLEKAGRGVFLRDLHDACLSLHSK